MGARIIGYETGTFTLFGEVFYTLAQVAEEPLATSQVPVFEGLRDGLKTVLLQEVDLLEQRAKAQATVDRTDDGLDRFVSKVVRTVDEHTDGPTKKQLRKKLLKGKSASRLKRPALGRQLADMSDWAKTLADCGVPALVALAPEADTRHKAGEAAAAVRDAALATARNFRDVGARKQFIDKLNAERKSAEGALAKLPFQNPALAQDFAEGFFLREAPRDEEEETIEELKASIVALENQLAEEKARLAQKEKEAAEAAKAAEAASEAEAEAAALEAQAAELLKKAASLKGKK
jgi:DNA repair exonuclease SbcCD ATPase subunit